MRVMSTESRSAGADPSTRTLIDDYLAAQQRLQTPVKRFADAHAGVVTEPVWRDLIPLSTPQAGEQYAFEVDLDRCTGCKACVAGCHSLNGLDEEETWRDVGMILGGSRAAPYQQTVTSACHHCEDPGCLNGCPVLAYEKDPITGIVRHLDDQCIGCQYCVLKCPYDVPKYSERLGIVRKCDMCHTRLSAGEAPACVQACPTQAIRIVTVSLQPARTPVGSSAFLTAAPDPAITRPTTRYVSRHPVPENALAADAAVPRLQPAHWPLVLMLTLMPMAVGVFAYDIARPEVSAALPLLGWAAAAAGLGASVFHLGQPLRAWRVFLGLRRSWLSREAVLFGAWFPLATLLAATHYLPAGLVPESVRAVLPGATVTLGAVALFCSVMIYVDTRRALWRFSQTSARFFGGGLVLGAAAAFAVAPHGVAAALLAIGLLAKLAVETVCLRALDEEVAVDATVPVETTPAFKTARLLTGPLRPVLAFRYLSAVSLLLLPSVLLAFAPGSALSWTVLGLALASELAERLLYFRAVAAPKMPGVLTP